MIETDTEAVASSTYLIGWLLNNHLNYSLKSTNIWVDIKVNDKIYSVNALYRPSTDNTNEKYDEFLQESEIILNNLQNHKSDVKIIASDLNFGNIYCKSPLLDHKPLDQTAPELFSSYGMQQLIDIPTRVREHTISLVDLFFVSTIDNVKAHGTLPAIADHCQQWPTTLN